MSEFPKAFPDVDSFVGGSLIITSSSVEALFRERQIVLSSALAPQVIQLMTPKSILARKSHARQVITPIQYPSFSSLLACRDLIRDLKLVPIREEGVQAEYEQMTRDTFLDIVRYRYLNGTIMSLVREMFPLNLPQDVKQHVVWIKDDSTSDRVVAEFIAKLMGLARLKIDDIILFERSRTTETEYVRVAIPEMRHIHLWTSQEIQIV